MIFFLALASIFSNPSNTYENQINNLNEKVINSLQALNIIEGLDNEYIRLDRKNLYFSDSRILLKLSDFLIEIPELIVTDNLYFLDYHGFKRLNIAIAQEFDKRMEQSWLNYEYQINFCSKSNEADQHFDKAKEHGLDFLQHSMQAGLSYEIPPIAIFELYNATQSLKNMADEYLKGKNLEKEFISHKSHDKSSHMMDHSDNLKSGPDYDPFKKDD